jgi:hypothetical protein
MRRLSRCGCSETRKAFFNSGRDNEHPNVPLPSDIPLFTDLLRDAGYEVAIVGKIHVRNGVEERNWDYYFGHNAPANNYENPSFKACGATNQTRRPCGLCRRLKGPLVGEGVELPKIVSARSGAATVLLAPKCYRLRRGRSRWWRSRDRLGRFGSIWSKASLTERFCPRSLPLLRSSSRCTPSNLILEIESLEIHRE